MKVLRLCQCWYWLSSVVLLRLRLRCLFLISILVSVVMLWKLRLRFCFVIGWMLCFVLLISVSCFLVMCVVWWKLSGQFVCGVVIDNVLRNLFMCFLVLVRNVWLLSFSMLGVWCVLIVQMIVEWWLLVLLGSGSNVNGLLEQKILQVMLLCGCLWWNVLMIVV